MLLWPGRLSQNKSVHCRADVHAGAQRCALRGASVSCSVSKELRACFVNTGPQCALRGDRAHGGGLDAAGKWVTVRQVLASCGNCTRCEVNCAR